MHWMHSCRKLESFLISKWCALLYVSGFFHSKEEELRTPVKFPAPRISNRSTYVYLLYKEISHLKMCISKRMYNVALNYLTMHAFTKIW